MTLSSFLKLVEIKTKVASIIPYLVGTLFALFMYETFDLVNALLMLMSLVLFDMTTTAINNYMDYHKAVKKHGYGYEVHNAIVSDNLCPRSVRIIIYGMLIGASLLGIILWLRTDIIVLGIGIISFIIGITYSFGPIPISRTPFGEIASGVTMGGIITFLASYIHLSNTQFIAIKFINGSLAFHLDLDYLICIALVSIPLIFGIANIMLANNICDLEDDLVNKRYTLPIYIGKPLSLKLFTWLYRLGFICILVTVLLGILPVFSLLTLLVYLPIRKHISAFNELQTKKDTFIFSVKNFLMLGTMYSLTLLVGCIWSMLN